MHVGNYLRKNQPIIYETFLNSLQNERLSHAYLLYGDPGTPLLEVAKYLAKSILCDDPSPLACNNCITCLRIDDENYPDFIVFDGSKSTIKKNEVNSIEKQFDKKAFESKGIMIYILHLVENMTVEAINSILKFLEEPNSEVYAFLTTNNESSILPTIVSRCQKLHLNLVDRQEVIDLAIEFGVKQDDAELLSLFYNDAELIHEYISDEDESESYIQAKKGIETLLDALNEEDSRLASYIMDSEIIPTLKGKESTRLFIDMLAQFFENIVEVKHGKEPILKSYDTMLRSLSGKLKHVDETLIELLKCRNLINLNVNNPLLLDHIIYTINS